MRYEKRSTGWRAWETDAYVWRMGKGGEDSVLIEGCSSATVDGVFAVGITDAEGAWDPAEFEIVRAGKLFVQDKAQAVR